MNYERQHGKSNGVTSSRTRFLLMVLLVTILPLILLMISSGTAYAAEPGGQPDQTMGMDPIVFAAVFLCIGLVIGIIAVLGGTGGGVIFTPLMMGFTPIDSFVIRATGLFVALCGSLIAARPFLRRGLANIKLILYAGVPYAVSAVIGAMLAGYIKATMGETGDAIIRLALGLLVVGLALLMILGGRRVEYPEVKNVDGFTERLGMSMSYYEESLGKIVNYKVNRAPVGILLFCGVGVISGLFGVGAGWAMVPVFNLLMLAPLKVAAASSKVLIAVGDAGAIWPYISSGGLFPLFAIPSMVGLVAGTAIGTKIMVRVKATFIRWLVIVVMSGSGIKLILDGLSRLGIM